MRTFLKDVVIVKNVNKIVNKSCKSENVNVTLFTDEN